MALAKVWNDNTHEYKEEFRGKEVKIPAKGHVVMELDEAMIFKGNFSPIVRDADGQPVPQFYKMIRVEKIGAEAPEVKVPELLCHSCRYLAVDKKDLEKHTKEAHADQMLVDEEAEQELKKKRVSKTS